MPRATLESELFGHVAGGVAFSSDAKIGLAELAFGGTLFLDEVDALPPELQHKLRRLIEAQEFTRVITSYSIHYTKLYEPVMPWNTQPFGKGNLGQVGS